MTEPAGILIVDDDPGMRETLADVLAARSYHVRIADSAKTALHSLSAAPADLALIDIMLPDMSGLELLQAIRAIPAGTEVVFITGHASVPSAIEAISGAAFAYVVKPFDMDHLLTIIAKAIERRRLTRALGETTQALEALVEASPLAIWALDPDDTVKMWSPAAERMFGWSRQEVLGRPLPVTTAAGARPGRELEDGARRGDALVGAETTLVRRDGSHVEVALSTAALRDASGAALGVAMIAADITERRRAEQALCESESSFRIMFADNPLPMWVRDLDTLRFLEVNAAAVAHYGYSRDEFLGMKITDIRPAEDVPRLIESVSSGPSRGPRDAGEWRHRCKDGRLIDVSVKSHFVNFGGRAAALIVVEDITERRRAEIARQESNQALVSVIESSPAAVMVLDEAGRVTRWNRSAERLFGWSEREVLGRPVPIIPDGEEAAWRDTLARWIAGGSDTALEVRRRRKDGAVIDVSLSAAPLRDATGRVVGIVGNLVDITERKLLEGQLRQAQKLEAIGSLAGGIAHDFNNLLTVISGRSHILRSRLEPDSPLRHDLELIEQTAERAGRLTHQLLAFSRKQVLEPRLVNLADTVGQMKRMLQRLIGEDVDLVTASDPDLWPVRVDPSQVEQVVLNLAVNARDAMPEGGRLTLETRNVELDEAFARSHADVQPGPHVLLAVTDTGHGMDAEVQAKIFEPFFTTKGPGRGTGLGLSTVYGIIKQSGGHIFVESEVGTGASFQIYLPRVDRSVAAAAAPSARPARGTETLLLVEDDDQVRALAREALQLSGYSVIEAASPELAIAFVREHAGRIDLLVSDVIMPGMNGRALADRVLALRRGLKVLFISGYPSSAIAQHGVLDPSTAFLHKPFTPAALARKVREVLDASA
jgi:PAS domain S-box-containing protein